MTKEELERTMRTLEPMYDMVRVVDPSTTEGRTLNESGSVDIPHQCFDVLSKGRRCRNCISARTLSCKKSVSKFEFVGDDAFYISTRYVEVDGQPRAIELIKRINDETLVNPNDETAAQEVRNIMEGDADRRYKDEETGALNQRYLDEGIEGLRGERVAMARVPGRQTAETLSIVAHAMLECLDKEDTLVRLENDAFVIIFENVSARRFPELLEQIRHRVAHALHKHDATSTANMAIGAVSQPGTLHELIDRAHKALNEALMGDRRIVLIGKTAGTQQDKKSFKPDYAAPVVGPRTHEVDALTGLLPADAFRVHLQERINALEEDAEPLHVVHLDIENFKAYNRAYGLPAGDVLLAQFAQTIRITFDGDLVGRTGVDTFGIVTTSEQLRDRIDYLRSALATIRRDVAIELKTGICTVSNAGKSAPLIMDHAKIACDSVKGNYSVCVRYFDGKLERQITVHDQVIHSLDKAIEKGYIRPYYQVIVRSFTKKACALEALSRWNDPDRGMISPGDVIPVLEQHHLIHRHDIHMVRCICRDLRNKIDQGQDILPVSVNLSRLDFNLCDIFLEVDRIVAEYDIPHDLLGIEVTESALDESGSLFRTQIERFRTAGYEIWMDDFGSGYSSLNLLKDYDFDVLKIDMAFLRGLEQNPTSKEIVSSVVDMAKRIGVRTLAEGVETQAQYEFLLGIGCEMIQGFLFARPTALALLDAPMRLGVEQAAERIYLDNVGRVNLLSQEPTEAMRQYDADMTQRGMPLAIIEWDGQSLRYLTHNDAYRAFLRSAAYANPADAERAMNDDDAFVQGFGRIAEAIGSSSVTQTLQYETARGPQMMTMQFVAGNDQATAYLVSPLDTRLYEA